MKKITVGMILMFVLVVQASAFALSKSEMANILQINQRNIVDAEKLTANFAEVAPARYAVYRDRIMLQEQAVTNQLLAAIWLKLMKKDEQPSCPGRGCPDPMGIFTHDIQHDNLTLPVPVTTSPIFFKKDNHVYVRLPCKGEKYQHNVEAIR